MKVLILLALAAYTQAIAPGDCQVDVVFVLDVSGSISDPEFADMLNFVGAVAGQLDIDSDEARVGAVRFGTAVYPGFDLPTFAGNSAGLQTAIAALAHQYSGTTNIAIGIEAMTQMFNDFGRGGVPWVGVVVTDGHSNWGDTAAAAELAKLTTTMIAVGVGNGVDPDELDIIASGPNFVIAVSEFPQLVDHINEVMALACVTNGGLYVCEAYSGTPFGPMVKTFDGLYAPIMAEQKTTMFRGKDEFLEDLDPCKTNIRCVTTRDTWWNRDYELLHLDWCGVALNVHQNPAKSHRNWIVGQTLNQIGERGQGLKGDTLLFFSEYADETIPYPDLLPAPYRAPACTPQQEAKVVGNSITITSPCCNWCVVWTPRVGLTSIQIIMDGSWAGQTEGMCGDSDGDLLNDWGSCDPICLPDDYPCLSNSCQGGDHDAQTFVGGTRIHEDTLNGSPPPGALFD